MGRPPEGPLLGAGRGPPGARAGVPLRGGVHRLANRRGRDEEPRPRCPRVPPRRGPRRCPPAGARGANPIAVTLLALPVVAPDARPHLLLALPLVHQSAALPARAREPAERPAAALGLADPVVLRAALARGVVLV